MKLIKPGPAISGVPQVSLPGILPITFSVIALGDGVLLIRLKSPPVDSKANKKIISVLAKKYQVSKSQIKFLSGTTSTHKLIQVN